MELKLSKIIATRKRDGLTISIDDIIFQKGNIYREGWCSGGSIIKTSESTLECTSCSVKYTSSLIVFYLTMNGAKFE